MEIYRGNLHKCNIYREKDIIQWVKDFEKVIIAMLDLSDNFQHKSRVQIKT